MLGGLRIQTAPEIFLSVEQVFNYKRGSNRYPKLEKLGPRPRIFFSVTALHVNIL